MRPATLQDIDAIILVHRSSVYGLCARDYSEAQLAAWTTKHATAEGRRRWEEKIRNEHVWVLDLDGQVRGFIHWREMGAPDPVIYLNALYMSPEIAGKGHGRRLLDLVVSEAGKHGVSRIETHATKNAVSFYQRAGFHPTGDVYRVSMGGVDIEAFPMTKAPLSSSTI